MAFPPRRILALAQSAHLRPIEHHFDAVAHDVHAYRLLGPERLDRLQDERQVNGCDRLDHLFLCAPSQDQLRFLNRPWQVGVRGRGI